MVFDAATVLTMPIPKLEHIKGSFVAYDVRDKEATVGFNLRARKDDTYQDLMEKLKELKKPIDN